MPNKQALVTGANGFVGSHLVKHLLASGWAVHIVVRPESNLSSLESVQHCIDTHNYFGNTASMRDVIQASCPHVVFHLASLFLSEHQPQDIPRLIESNLLFGTQLVEAMTLEGANYLVNTGTSWQHFENQSYSPVNLYAATKQAFEVLLEYYVEARELRVITLKLFDTYGPNDPRPKLLNLLKGLVNHDQRLAMTAGEQKIDMVHVEDVVRAFTIASDRLMQGKVLGMESYAVSSGRHLHLRELVNMVETKLVYKLPIDWGAKPYRKREVMTPWRGKQLPGWFPERDFDG